MSDELPERRFTRALGLQRNFSDKGKLKDSSSDSSLSQEKKLCATLGDKNKQAANITTRSTAANKKNIVCTFDGESYAVGDTVYVDSHRPDIPWYIGTVKQARQTKKEVLIEWFYRSSEIPEPIYQTLLSDRLLENTSKLKHLDTAVFKSKELFSSNCSDYCTFQALRGKCRVEHFNGLPEKDLEDYVTDKDNWFYILSYNPSSRRLASTQGEIRIGSSHQAELPEYLEVEVEKREAYCTSPESQCWIPGKLSDKELKHYIRVARSVSAIAGICNGGSMEKGISVAFNDAASFDALEFLHESKYDPDEAVEGMVALAQRKSAIKWAEEEKRLFEQGIKQFGKHFDKIRREYLPKKNTKEIVEYYYLWKMTPAALNIRYAKKKGPKNNGHPFNKKCKLTNDNQSSDAGDGSSGDGSSGTESEESNADLSELQGRDDLMCDHCKSKESERWRYGGSNKMVLCAPCRLHFKRFGEMPPLSESSLSESSLPGSVTRGGSEGEAGSKPSENNVEKMGEEGTPAPAEQEEDDKIADQSGELLIDDDEDPAPPAEEEEEEEEEMEDTEAKEEPNKVLTVKFGHVTFKRPSCRGWDRCSRTDLRFEGTDQGTKKETPVAKAERTPIKSEAGAVFSAARHGFSPLLANGMIPGPGMMAGPGMLSSAGMLSGAGMFRGQIPSSSGMKMEPKMEPSYAQAKIMEIFQQQEAAKLKMQTESLYSLPNMPQGLRPPLPHGLLSNFQGIRQQSIIDSQHQKLLQGLHPQLQHDQIMEHLEALARQQQHQQAVAAQQHLQQQQAQQQQQQQHPFNAERIQELIKSARTAPEQKYLQEQLIEAASRDAFARQQQAAAAHLLPQQAEQPQQASQWARFIENHAIAAAQQNAAAQHNAAAAAQHNAAAHHNAQHRGFELPHNMASAIHHQQQQQQQQQRTQLPHIHQQQPDRKRETYVYPYHRLFPIMKRRHNAKKQECKLKADDDEIIFMGTNGAPHGPPHSAPHGSSHGPHHGLPHPAHAGHGPSHGATPRTLASHLPSHLTVGGKPSFSPLPSPSSHRLPNASSLTNSQQLGILSNSHYANLMKVFQNRDILRGHSL